MNLLPNYFLAKWQNFGGKANWKAATWTQAGKMSRKYLKLFYTFTTANRQEREYASRSKGERKEGRKN
jgi:hypothetical protein